MGDVVKEASGCGRLFFWQIFQEHEVGCRDSCRRNGRKSPSFATQTTYKSIALEQTVVWSMKMFLRAGKCHAFMQDGKYRQIDGIFLKISRCQGDFVSLAVCSICYAEFIVLNYYNSGEFVELINAQNICFVHFQT
ncbi:unnamed protein product [Dracunculus medinensis]|uniref:Uncharacterized protein n=1 Tax=Dracunculus medinensis TaxID=318479 RepID=A0A0N4UC09_DRAME|nr:unnamed protein product [Dracunculus medinensis]